MGWSGGIFTRVHDWTEDEAGGYDIVASRFDEEDDNFESGINACLTKDGTNTPTANLPMGTFRHTGVGDGQVRTDYASVGQVQDSAFKYSATGGALNAYTLTLTPAPAAYATGQQFNFKANRTNSGATTLNVNGLGAKNVYASGAACTGGEIVISRVYSVIYDGTQFHLVSGGGTSGTSLGGSKRYLSSNQELLNNTAAMASFNAIDYTDTGYYSPPSTWLFRIPTTGRYRITALVRLYTSVMAPPDNGNYLCEMKSSAYFRRNNVEMTGSRVWNHASNTWEISQNMPNLSLVWEGSLTANDTIDLYAYQRNTYWDNPGSSPVAVGGSATIDNASWMAIERIY